jgi:hypothetical protein
LPDVPGLAGRPHSSASRPPALAVDAGGEEVRLTDQGNGFVLFGKFSFVIAMPRCGFCSNQFRA